MSQFINEVKDYLSFFGQCTFVDKETIKFLPPDVTRSYMDGYYEIKICEHNDGRTYLSVNGTIYDGYKYYSQIHYMHYVNDWRVAVNLLSSLFQLVI